MKREELLELFKGKEIDNLEDIVKSILDINGKETAKKQKTIDEYSEKYKDYDDLKSKLEEIEKGKMTDQEKLEKALKEAEETTARNNREYTKFKVKNVFAENGMVEEDYKDFIDSMNFDDEQTALKCASGFANLLKLKTEAASKKAKEDVLNDAPTPTTGKGEDANKTMADAPKPYTSAEILEMYK